MFIRSTNASQGGPFILSSWMVLSRVSLFVTFALVLSLHGVLNSAQAESSAFQCGTQAALSAAKRTELLDKVQNNYGAVRSLTASFLQYSYLASLETSETSSGKVWFDKPGKMHWHYVEPDAQDFLVRNDTVWLYQELDNQIIIDEFRKILLSDAPVSFLMGLGNLRRDFEVRSACQNEDGLLFELVPRAKGGGASDLKGFKLLVDPQSFMPKGASVTDVGDNITSIILSDLKTNSTVPAGTFEPNFPKSADIIDRRKANG